MFFAKCCQGPIKTTSAAEKFSVNVKKRERRQKLAKKESEHPEKENNISAASCIFVFALRFSLEYQWILSSSDGSVGYEGKHKQSRRRGELHNR